MPLWRSVIWIFSGVLLTGVWWWLGPALTGLSSGFLLSMVTPGTVTFGLAWFFGVLTRSSSWGEVATMAGISALTPLYAIVPLGLISCAIGRGCL